MIIKFTDFSEQYKNNERTFKWKYLLKLLKLAGKKDMLLFHYDHEYCAWAADRHPIFQSVCTPRFGIV